MILQDDIGKQLELTLALEIAPRIIDQFEGFQSCENRCPSHDGASHEVRIFRLEEAITASGHAPIVPRSGASGSAFPSGAWERGGNGTRHPATFLSPSRNAIRAS